MSLTVKSLISGVAPMKSHELLTRSTYKYKITFAATAKSQTRRSWVKVERYQSDVMIHHCNETTIRHRTSTPSLYYFSTEFLCFLCLLYFPSFFFFLSSQSQYRANSPSLYTCLINHGLPPFHITQYIPRNTDMLNQIYC